MPTEPKSIGDLFVGFRPGGVFDHWKFPTGKLVDFTGFDALQIRAVFDFLGDRARPRGGREYFSWRLQPLVDTRRRKRADKPSRSQEG